MAAPKFGWTRTAERPKCAEIESSLHLGGRGGLRHESLWFYAYHAFCTL